MADSATLTSNIVTGGTITANLVENATVTGNVVTGATGPAGANGVAGSPGVAGWKFIKFMTTEPGQRLGFKQGIASIPNSRALATELVPTYRLPHNSRIILELLPQATLPFWCQAISDTELEDVLVNAPYPNAPELEDLYKGRATAAQAMPRVNRRVQALLTADQGLARTFGTKLHL